MLMCILSLLLFVLALDVNQTPNLKYIQTTQGGDLLNCMENHEFPEEWAKFYVKEIMLAIEVVHKIGYVHRDIKPDNVLLDASGHVKLADFGTCTKIIDERGRAKARDLIGTRFYF